MFFPNTQNDTSRGDRICPTKRGIALSAEPLFYLGNPSVENAGRDLPIVDAALPISPALDFAIFAVRL